MAEFDALVELSAKANGTALVPGAMAEAVRALAESSQREQRSAMIKTAYSYLGWSRSQGKDAVIICESDRPVHAPPLT